jgi:aldehyde dehydrogenase (NAD+)
MRSHETATGAVFHNFVDGRWTASSSGGRFENRNPANHGDLIGVFQESTPADANEAIQAAQRA